LSQPYWQSYEAGIKAEGKAEDATVIVADQKSSEQAQVSGSANLINQGISALIVSPVQPAALPATITAAHNAKIPVVIGDVGAAGDYDAYVTSDNANGGKLAADYVIKALGSTPGSHEVGIISLHAGSVVGEDRVNGFTTEIATNSNFKVVSTLNGNDTVAGGFAAAQNMLSANPGLDAIYAANDPEAEGTVRALEAAGKSASNGFVLIGFNGDAPALTLIGQGEMTATVAQDPYSQGELAVKTAIELLRGKSVAYTDASTKTLLVPVEIVDKSNLASFEASRANQ
jgi:ribose transport system substrate-binding protein